MRPAMVLFDVGDRADFAQKILSGETDICFRNTLKMMTTILLFERDRSGFLSTYG